MLAAALWAAVGVWTPAASSAAEGQAPDSLGIRLVDAPTDRRDDPRASRSVIDHLRPGAEIERRIELISTMGAAVDVPLYVGAATVEDGTFLPADRDDDGNLITSWTSVDPARVTVPAGGRVMATVRILVPPDAPEGEHYGVVWAELPAGGGAVTVVNRVGVRIYLSVGPGAEPASDFELDSLRASRTAAGEPVVSARVTNTGGRALDFRGELLLLDGPASTTAGPFAAETGRTLGVGQSTEIDVVLDPVLADGPWLARMTLRSGELERTAEATVEFPASGESSGPVDAVPFHRDRGFLVPVAVGLLVLAFVLVFLVRFRARRRTNDDPSSDGTADDADGRAASAETLAGT